jgi:hypothetical protein
MKSIQIRVQVILLSDTQVLVTSALIYSEIFCALSALKGKRLKKIIEEKEQIKLELSA